MSKKVNLLTKLEVIDSVRGASRFSVNSAGFRTSTSDLLATLGVLRLTEELPDLRREAVEEAGEDELDPTRSFGVRTSMGILQALLLLNPP